MRVLIYSYDAYGCLWRSARGTAKQTSGAAKLPPNVYGP